VERGTEQYGTTLIEPVRVGRQKKRVMSRHEAVCVRGGGGAPVFTVFLTVRMTMAAALASRPEVGSWEQAGCQHPALPPVCTPMLR